MSKPKPNTEIKNHQTQAISKVNYYIDQLISSGDGSKADKFCYWLEDYIKFLSYEPQFKPQNLKRYIRGEILKVHLGYNIGSEEGGLHYCVVLDKNNSIHNPVITVIPLTSVKPNTDLEHLHPSKIYLGDDIYNQLNMKVFSLIGYIKKTLKHLKEEHVPDDSPEVERLEDELELLQKTDREVKKMKQGSIALTQQITTISKIRIYDPKTMHDVLSGIRLSADNLNKIDNILIKSYTK